MAVQSTPPIQLDPSMDTGHQLAFTNQNFNNIASVISQNSFVIVSKPTANFSISGGVNGSTGSITVPHNLGYVPLAIGTVTISSSTVVTAGSIIPLPLLVPGISGIQNSTTSLPVNFIMMSVSSVDTANFFLSWSLIFGSHTAVGTITFYVLQQTAN